MPFSEEKREAPDFFPGINSLKRKKEVPSIERKEKRKREEGEKKKSAALIISRESGRSFGSRGGKRGNNFLPGRGKETPPHGRYLFVGKGERNSHIFALFVETEEGPYSFSTSREIFAAGERGRKGGLIFPGGEKKGMCRWARGG